ncbi:MAG: transglycosylase SLT domain-containing protein [Bdellovibrio sp.]
MKFWPLPSFFKLLGCCAVIGCTSTAQSVLNFAPPLSDDESQWMDAYKTGLVFLAKDSQRACELFSDLSQKNWILSASAQIRRMQSCPKSKNLSLEQEQRAPWLIRFELEIRFQQAQIRKDLNELAFLYLEKGKLSRNLDEKQDLYLQGLKAAQQAQSPPTRIIEELQKKLESVAPRFIPQPRESQYLAVGKDWMQARDFEKARSFFKRVKQSKHLGFELQLQAYIESRNSYKVQGKNPEHLRAAEQLVQWLKKNKQLQKYFEASLYLARAIWTQGRSQEARRLLLNLEKEIGKRLPLGELHWLLGRMSDEDERHSDAVMSFARAAKNLPAGDKLLETVENAQAWSLRKLKKYKEASSIYRNLASRAQDNSNFRALFWSAKSLSDAGELGAAQALFQQIAREDVLGYYGILAHLELGMDLAPLTRTQDWSLSSQIPQDLVLTADRLFQVGEREMLFEYLNFQMGNLGPAQLAANPDLGFFFLKSLARAGFYLDLFRELGKMSSPQRKRFFSNFPELVFPLDFQDEISLQSQRFQVPEEIPLAIIRQESAFSPVARSRADAMGLMQLLPTVAFSLSKKHQLPYQDYRDLFDPKVNIPLGVAFLSDLLKNCENNLILVAARYNANATSLSRWLQTRYKGNAIEFIEDIPFSETQTYVKLILRNAIFYKRMRNENRATPLPRHYFAISQAHCN